VICPGTRNAFQVGFSGERKDLWTCFTSSNIAFNLQIGILLTCHIRTTRSEVKHDTILCFSDITEVSVEANMATTSKFRLTAPSC
jgi:hypothetical protein